MDAPLFNRAFSVLPQAVRYLKYGDSSHRHTLCRVEGEGGVGWGTGKGRITLLPRNCSADVFSLAKRYRNNKRLECRRISTYRTFFPPPLESRREKWKRALLYCTYLLAVFEQAGANCVEIAFRVMAGVAIGACTAENWILRKDDGILHFAVVNRRQVIIDYWNPVVLFLFSILVSFLYGCK